MHLRFLLASCLVILASAAPEKLPWMDVMDPVDESENNVLKFQSTLDLEQEWTSFKENYGKVYSDDTEESVRKQIFADNLRKIEAHNQFYSQGLTTFTLGVNEYADMELQEFLEQMTCYSFKNLSEAEEGSTFMPPEINFTLPKEVDWRNNGFVTPVKNQRSCGSCWAFSATGSLEGQHFRKKRRLVSLSEQNLVDCSKQNYGCRGGWVNKAFEYIRDNRGIDTEISYPYEGKDAQCRFKRQSVGATCKGVRNIRRGSETSLQQAVATVGPISVAIDAGQHSFQSYKSGIYNEPRCSTTHLNHAVLVVGYGSTGGRDYWIVKNSWGTGWGNRGYILMSRNRRNQCGIANAASYPLV